MRNVKVEIKGDSLILTVNLKEPPTVSSTGATLVLASTLGNARIGEKGAPEGLAIGLNVTLPNPNRPPKTPR